jgi:hypothetical protein
VGSPQPAPPAPSEPLLSANTLIASLVAIIFLAFVLPPGLALGLQRSRANRATVQLHAVSAALDASCLSSASTELAHIDLLVGPGDPIENSLDRQWISPRSAPLLRCMHPNAPVLAPDPWLRPLMINIAAAREQRAVWLLSAGPNGIVETSFTAQAIAGDDMGIALAPSAR